MKTRNTEKTTQNRTYSLTDTANYTLIKPE